MRSSSAALGLVATLGMAQLAGAAQIVPAVGVFDPVFGPVNGIANPSVNGVVSNEAGMSVTSWQTRLADAYAAGLGGAWNGSDSTGSDTASGVTGVADTSWQLTLAGGKAFRISTPTTAGMALQPAGTGSWTSMTAISGYRFIGTSTIQANASTMSFSLDGFDPSAKITELGFAYIGRSGSVGSAVSFTVTYDDLTTASTGNFTPLGLNNASLIHFLAPEGRSITRMDMAINGSRGVQFDDIGVIVSVPEPAVFGLVGLFSTALLARRRP